MVEAFRASGRSVKQFSREYGLDPQRLRRWLGRLEGAGVTLDAESVSFAPVVVTGVGQPAVVVVRTGAVEVEVADPAVDPRWVAGLLDAIAAPTPGGDT